MEAIEKIKDLSRNVQTGHSRAVGGKQDDLARHRTGSRICNNITNLTEGHRKDASNVSSIVAKNMKIIEENMRRVQEMENGVESLITLTTSLNEEIGRFQFAERKTKT